MAKRRNQYMFPSQRPAPIERMDQSRFWLRLDELSAGGLSEERNKMVDHLKSSIRKVTEQAKWISTQICRFMPQYTLHEERHFLNVLAIMDAIVPDDVVSRMDALDCGLTILAAYTHDLGMALSQVEFDQLRDESTAGGKHFASYRTRSDEVSRQLARWKNRRGELAREADAGSRQEAIAAQRRVDVIKGHILASYLRDTHTEDDQIRRLRHWLEAIKKETRDDNLFRYGNFDYQRSLVLIGISHGHCASWLRRQLIDAGHEDRFYQPVASGESANLAFPGLLIRLADIMDFDASRAPEILFKHFGIENDKSILEWNKHLSIVGWRLDVDREGKRQPDLLYSAQCEHPVHEKAIREYKSWIDDELSAVRVELDAQRRQLPTGAQHLYKLHLPSQTRLDIRPARDPLTDQPKYVYHDLQFRLDQNEIQQLLMGESLYGDPGLCIRELLQNSIDALELRELRLKMKHKGEAQRPVDGELIRPGWVREPDGIEDELRVVLDWGTDEESGQQWLRVVDNGVGMTTEVIENYFTQIGKSYYRSPEFSQERAAMRASGEVVSPISYFGIGILSCFMIAERLKIRTSAGQAEQSYDIDIDAPSSLFWLRPGSRRRQGTEILLQIKSDFEIIHDAEDLVPRLRKHFNYLTKPPVFNDEVKVPDLPKHVIDPVFLAAAHVVWPVFPIVSIIEEEPILVIDRNYHSQLFPIDRDRLVKIAGYWGCPAESVDDVGWRFWDWRDDAGFEATGTRVRMCYVGNTRSLNQLPENMPNRCRQYELAAFLHTQYDTMSGYGIYGGSGILKPALTIINGMFVEQLWSYRLSVSGYRSANCWIDFRGDAAPPLTANREKTRSDSRHDNWIGIADGVFNRMLDALGNEISQSPSGGDIAANLRLGWRFSADFSIPAGDVPSDFDFLEACKASWYARHEHGLCFAAAHLIQNFGRLFDRKVFDRASDLSRSSGRRFFVNADKSLLDNPDLDRDIERRRVADYLVLAVASLADDEKVVELLSDLCSEAYTAQSNPLREQFREELSAWFLQDGFWPNLEGSWPIFRLFALSGRIGDAALKGPSHVVFDREGSGRSVSFSDPQGKTPVELVRLGYDLTFPMTAVPLGKLRRECSDWRTDRWRRTLGVAPFLFRGLNDIWLKHAEFLQHTFGVPYIYCLLPRLELWSKPFSDWTDADWQDPYNLSALWDLSGHFTSIPGQVLWARGTLDIHEMPKIGLPAPAFSMVYEP